MGRRKRASRDKVRENAEKGGQGGSNWFDLPEGVRDWAPDKAERYSIDILPYEVKSNSHPDEVEKGLLWYKFPFAVHHGVGPTSTSVVCPGSLGERCPICEERQRLYKEDSDKHEDLLRELRAQKFVAYNTKDPEDDQKVAIFIMSRGKFAAPLENELKDPDNEEHLCFWDVDKNGRTLRARFTEKDFGGKKYLEATKIDFKSRDEMDEDGVLDKVVCLEEALITMPYDKLRELFYQEGDGDDDDPQDPEPEPEKKQPDEEPSKDEDEPKDDPDDDKPKCKACDGSGKASNGRRCKACKGTGVKEEEPEPEPEPEPEKEDTLTCPECGDEFDAEDAEHSKKLDEDFCSKKCLKRAEKKAKAAKEDDPEPEPEEKPKGGDLECPVDGGTFGDDVEKYDECDDCPIWEKCEEASD